MTRERPEIIDLDTRPIAAAPVDRVRTAPVDGSCEAPPPSGGCCDARASAHTPIALLFVVALYRRRRRRASAMTAMPSPAPNADAPPALHE